MARGRRGNHEGSITKRKDGRWMARATVPGTGRRIHLYARTREEVARKLAEALRQLHQGIPPAQPGRRTVADLLQAWLASKRGRVRPRTLERYGELVSTHLLPHLGSVRLSRLGPDSIEVALAAMLADGITPSTARLALTVLRQACKAGERWGWLARNPATFAQVPARAEPPPQRFLTPEEARRLLAALEGERRGPLLAFLLATGCRLGEALALRWTDVDLDAGSVRIERTLRLQSADAWEMGPVKAERSRRTLTLPRLAVDAVREERRLQAEERLLAGPAWQDHGLVFAGPSGEPLQPRSVRRAFKVALARAGLPRELRVHDLRHSTASLLLAAGLDLRIVQDVLGHASIAMTADVYTAVTPRLRQEAARRLDELLG